MPNEGKIWPEEKNTLILRPYDFATAWCNYSKTFFPWKIILNVIVDDYNKMWLCCSEHATVTSVKLSCYFILQKEKQIP